MGAGPHDGRPDGERAAAEAPPGAPDEGTAPQNNAGSGTSGGIPATAPPLPAATPVQFAPHPPPREGGLPPVPVRTHRWGLGAFVLAEAAFLLVSLGLRYLFDEFGDSATPGALAALIVVPTVVAAAIALRITSVRGNGPRIDLGLVWSWRDVGLGIAFGVSGLVLVIPASVIYVSIFGPDATSAVGMAVAGMRSGPALAIVLLLAVALVGPACEEILYRGLLWGGLERLAGRWWAFGLSTLLFALLHFEFERTPLLLVVAIPLAVARLYTGRLLASIVAHQINNLLPAVVIALGLLGVVPMA